MVGFREGVRFDADEAKNREPPRGGGGSCSGAPAAEPAPVAPGGGRGETWRCGRPPPSDLAGQLGIIEGWIACGRSWK